MRYITTTVDVDIDYDDIDDDQLLDIVEDRVKTYKKDIDKYPHVAASNTKKLDKFISDIRETVGLPSKSSEGSTLLDEMYEDAFKKIRDKFSIDEVEAFLKSKL
jgi:hypothetical protein